MGPQAKKRLETPEAGGGREAPPLEPSEEAQPYPRLDCRLLTSRPGRTNFWVLKYFTFILRERETGLLFHIFIHSLVDSYMCPDLGSNLQPCQYRSNQLGYSARARFLLF